MNQQQNNARWQEERRSTRNHGRNEHVPVTAERLKHLREKEGLTWPELSERFGRPESTLRNIAGRSKPKKSGKKKPQVRHG
jgi:DNA-binding transcriptional regulator YiaG